MLGRDGTVARWNRRQPAAGNVHVKTGTLSDVRAAAGVTHNPGGDILFVIIISGRSTANARRAIQQLLDWSYALDA